jgi:uncharacterized protein YbjT (DUF2867 family)
MWVRAIVRRPQQQSGLQPWTDDIVVAEVTKPDTLRHVADDVDVVFSSIGITRQRDGFTYEDVDYRGNVNLLTVAKARSVSRFVYVSILQGPSLRELPMVDAKERFVGALRESGLPYTILRPTGFFSDMTSYVTMARRGLVVLFGDGTAQINPISGRDLATACADAMLGCRSEIPIGGPYAFSYNSIAAMAFHALRKRPRVWHLKGWQTDALARIARSFTPRSLGGPLEFVLTVTRRDMIAPRFGQDRLDAFLEQGPSPHVPEDSLLSWR